MADYADFTDGEGKQFAPHTLHAKADAMIYVSDVYHLLLLLKSAPSVSSAVKIFRIDPILETNKRI
jgi:hypothetical protein